MRHFPLITATFLAFSPIAARAEVNCTVFDAIERIQFAENRLAQISEGRFSSQDANLIISEMARLDADQISIAHSNTLSLIEAATLIAFIDKAQTLTALLKSRNALQTQRFFDDPEFLHQQHRVARILPRLKCNAFTLTGTSNGTERVLSSIKQEARARKITFVGSATFLASLVFSIAVAYRIYALMTERRMRKKRRSRRFHCHLETQVNYGPITKRGVILDISCNGAKVQIDLEDEEPTVEIWIINQWHKASVSWHNAHYLGIRFETPLRGAFVEAICHPVHAP